MMKLRNPCASFLSLNQFGNLLIYTTYEISGGTRLSIWLSVLTHLWQNTTRH